MPRRVALAAALVSARRARGDQAHRGHDTIFGTDGIDQIDGRGGEDCLDGGAGDDVLTDGLRNPVAADRLIGGAGNDTIRSGNGNDAALPRALRLDTPSRRRGEVATQWRRRRS